MKHEREKNESEHTNTTIPFQASQNDAWIDHKKQSWEIWLSKYNNSAPLSGLQEQYFAILCVLIHTYVFAFHLRMTACVMEGGASPLACFLPNVDFITAHLVGTCIEHVLVPTTSRSRHSLFFFYRTSRCSRWLDNCC